MRYEIDGVVRENREQDKMAITSILEDKLFVCEYQLTNPFSLFTDANKFTSNKIFLCVLEWLIYKQ